MKGVGYLNVLSLGAGKQSSYLLLKNLSGDFDSRVNYAVFSDTGNEPRHVYNYLNWLILYCKRKYNFDISVIRSNDLIEDTTNFLAGSNKRGTSIPCYMSPTGAPMRRQCTLHYKIRPIRKFVRPLLKGKKLKLWIGISLDEMQRMKVSDVQYIELYYPLVKNRISIDNIKHFYLKNGFTEPGKSSCLVCPFHSDQYWYLLKKQSPDEFEFACAFDELIRVQPRYKGHAFLHKSMQPLRTVAFVPDPSLFSELIDECEGLCGI